MKESEGKRHHRRQSPENDRNRRHYRGNSDRSPPRNNSRRNRSRSRDRDQQQPPPDSHSTFKAEKELEPGEL